MINSWLSFWRYLLSDAYYTPGFTTVQRLFLVWWTLIIPFFPRNLCVYYEFTCVHHRPTWLKSLQVKSYQIKKFITIKPCSNQEGISTRGNRNPRRINARGVLLVKELTSVAHSCTQEECLCFWSVKSISLFCTRFAVAMNNEIRVNQLAPKFAHVDRQVAIDERDGAHVEESDEKFVALPGKVVESLLSQSCDPKEIIRQLNEELQLNLDSLKRPGPETIRMIRCLARKAKSSNRFDVVKHLREITPAGTTGPMLPEQLDVQNVPVTQMRDLTMDLSGGDEWKVVAEKLGLTPRKIRFFDKRTLNPFDAALAFIANQRHISVGTLYNILIECGCPMIADDL